MSKRLALAVLSTVVCPSLLADTADIVAAARPSVALIRHRNARGEVLTGSGFVVMKDGAILTCAHVVDPGSLSTTSESTPPKTWVRLAGSSHEATVAWRDETWDLALLKIEGGPYDVLPLATNAPRTGEDVLLLGYPRGDEIGKELVVTKGIISSVRAEGTVLQLDAATNPGNSGGPVLSAQGEVLGVAYAKIPGYEGGNFAISMNAFLAHVRSVAKSGDTTGPAAPARSAPRRFIRGDSPEVLEGLAGVGVLVEGLGEDAKEAGLSVSRLQTDVELKLRQSGIKVFSDEERWRDSRSACLYINVNVLSSSRGYAASVSVSLDQRMLLSPEIVVGGCRVWDRGTIAICGRDGAEDYFRSIVRDQVEAFCNDYLKANPKPK
jgi:S1-C subfamily serine protease